MKMAMRFSENRTSLRRRNRCVRDYNGVSTSAMPRFKPKGVLERTAVNDLWKHTLSRISTVFGRLAYLASLRDTNSGIYRHHGLSTAFGRDESVRALRSSHEEVFLQWLKLSLAEKHDDLRKYLMTVEDPSKTVVHHWLQSRAYRLQIPTAARPAEGQLYCSEIEALLEIMRGGLDGDGSDRASSLSA